MSGDQTLTKRLRVDELIKKWGSDPLNWGVRDTSALLKTDPNNWSGRLIASLHRLAKRTRTLADRDFVTSKLLTQVADRITDALFEPPNARVEGDAEDLLPSDVDHVYNKLQKTFEAVDALYEASGDTSFRYISNNKHMPAASPLAWDLGFITRFTALIKTHPKRHRIIFTEVFPRAISSRRRLNPDSPEFLTTTDLMSVPDIYAKVVKEMPEVEQEESEKGEEENKEKEKAEEPEEPEYPSAPRYKTAYGKMLAERLDNLELGFKDLRKNIEEAKKEIRGP
ncbi:hypothetical protein DIS24_g1117 [Lasiodiplodia hormozganensis]|uniref:Uncharacterized protein n=1 Tax=Lasiodiplodia hormozganensis TaxID=869390 RepID=A0AA39Z533_9PEZI|nr:hypothetical protein DIS24_g1117 [Lasiodiplodia hormozganensis]